MINFCTLFDSNYLTRGLAMYQSLCQTTSFHLYVIAFNDACYQYLKNKNLPHLTAIALNDFEDEELLKIKSGRSAAEYCWTCTPSVILYCIKKFNLPSCAYIDADMIFYADPKVLIDEVADKSILLTEHRYTGDYEQSVTHGRYCVQFMFFRNDFDGMTALSWWRDRCLEWCYAKLEDGKFGDQKYLDDWKDRFKGVHVLQHEGGGVAPWNIQQYYFKNDSLTLVNKITGKEYPLVFFHFHGVKFFTDGFISCCGPVYELNSEVKARIYLPYFKKLTEIEKKLKLEGIVYNINGARTAAPGKREVYWEYIKQRLVLWKVGNVSITNLKLFHFREHYHFYTLNSI